MVEENWKAVTLSEFGSFKDTGYVSLLEYKKLSSFCET